MRALAAALLLSAGAAAGPVVGRASTSPPTPVSAATVASLKPLAFFASAAYCPPSVTLNWSCGANCNALPGFIPTAAGGDGSSVQFWFVGFHPPLNAVVVAHQGTDPSHIEPLLEDADAILGSLNSTLFPGVSSSVHAHDGFADSQSKTASQVLAAVQKTMSAHGAEKVVLASHSLGAAIAVLDAMFLQLHLPSGTTFQVANFGQPRIGNQAFADYVDAHFGGVLTHTSNKLDLVPILPGRFLGYVHPSGEIHIQESGAVVACAGQDDTASGCTISDVPNIFESDESDHDGPYFGVEMGC